MAGIPSWFTAATVGWGAALGGALATFWFGIYPLHDPNIAVFATTCGAVSLFGVQDTLRAQTDHPPTPARAVWELLLGGALAALLTRSLPQFCIAATLLLVLRGQAGALTRVIVDLYASGAPEVARRTHERVQRLVLVTAGIGTALVVWNGLDPSARPWRSAPFVLLAGISGLILLSGAAYAVVRARFRRGGARVDAAFRGGWWASAGGLIVAAVIVSAVVPAPPAFFSLAQVGAAARRMENDVHPYTPGNPGGPFLPTYAHNVLTIGPSGVVGREPRYGLYVLGVLLAALAVTAVTGQRRSARPCGMDVFDLVAGDARELASVLTAAISWFVRFYRLGVGGMRGAGGEMGRLPRRWPGWLPDVVAAGPMGDGRRRIRALYRRCLRGARKAGIGRAPHQTPRAFQAMVETSEPAMAGGLGALTGAYEWARFSPHPVTPAHVTRAVGGWAGVSRLLAQRRARSRVQAAGQAVTPLRR